MFSAFFDMLWAFWFPPAIDGYDHWPVPDPYGKTNRPPCVSGCNTHN